MSITTPKSQWLSYSGQETDEWSGGVATFSNGDIATAYSVSKSNGASSVIVQRLNTNGAVVWSLDIGADYAPGAGSVLVDSDDKVYVTGGTKKGSTGESGKNDSDIFAVSLSPEGQKLWYENYGIGIHEIGSSAVLDANGNLILNGRVSEVNDGYSFIKDVPNFYGAEFSGGWRGFQLKINPEDGSITKAYTTGSGNSGGGRIAIDKIHNIAFVGGYTFSGVNGVDTVGNGDPNGANTYLIARDEDNGTVLWTRMENWMRSNVVTQESENAIYFVDKGNLEKVNGSTGETIWSKALTNTGYTLSPINGGGVLLSESESNGTLTIRRIDAGGSETGSQVISHTGTLHPRAFIEQGDGKIQISGSTSGTITVDEDTTTVVNPKQAGRDAFILKTNSAFSDPPEEEGDTRTWEETSYEDFESGATDWSINSIGSTPFYGNYLGDFDSRQQNIQVSKVYEVDRFSATKIELDFIRFDSWSNEFVRFYVDDTLIFERGIDSYWNLDQVEAASVDGVHLTFSPNADYGNRGHSSYWNDQSFSVEIIVPEGKDSIKVGVASNLDQWVGDESWGIDNVRLSKSVVNDAPTNVTISTTNFDENIAANTVVAKLSSTDPDSNEAFAYDLVSGKGSKDNNAFKIIGNKLKIKRSPNHELKPSYLIRVQTEDSAGLTYQESFTLNVNDIKPETVRSSTSYTLKPGEENLILTGNKAINGIGNTLNNKITGNNANNTINGKQGADEMRARKGNDIYYVDNKNDKVIELANQGTDTVRSSVTEALSNNVENLELKGSKAINGIGNNLNNKITGNNANNTINGKQGGDTMRARKGNDIYYVDNKNDKVIELANQGTDTVRSSVTETLSNNVENLELKGSKAINGTGNNLNNKITGNNNKNNLKGLNGKDEIYGRGGKDVLTGGAKADQFIYKSITDSGTTNATRDIITDFSVIDKINLSKIDANELKNGNQEFEFIGSKPFTEIGQVRFGKGNGFLSMNTDNDSEADMQINLLGVTSFKENFLIL